MANIQPAAQKFDWRQYYLPKKQKPNETLAELEEVRQRQGYKAWAKAHIVKALPGQECPSDWQPVVDLETCYKAASVVGNGKHRKSRTIEKGSWRNRPTGCFTDWTINQVVYFNSGTGSPSDRDERICSKVSPASKEETTNQAIEVRLAEKKILQVQQKKQAEDEVLTATIRKGQEAERRMAAGMDDIQREYVEAWQKSHGKEVTMSDKDSAELEKGKKEIERRLAIIDGNTEELERHRKATVFDEAPTVHKEDHKEDAPKTREDALVEAEKLRAKLSYVAPGKEKAARAAKEMEVELSSILARPEKTEDGDEDADFLDIEDGSDKEAPVNLPSTTLPPLPVLRPVQIQSTAAPARVHTTPPPQTDTKDEFDPEHFFD